MTLACPLCESQPVAPYVEISKENLTYSHCGVCDLVFMNPQSHLKSEAERERYVIHENTIETPGYQDYLNRLRLPFQKYLKGGESGLDYGCGPGPVLAELLRREGYEMQIYDPFFAPERSVLKREYDFVTCTEVVEHFNAPRKEFATLAGLLRVGGHLGVMTQKRPDSAEAFIKWHYRRDPTHISFYNDKTMTWIAQAHGLEVCESTNSIWIFRKL